jgi:hypothetical protein
VDSNQDEEIFRQKSENNELKVQVQSGIDEGEFMRMQSAPVDKLFSPEFPKKNNKDNDSEPSPGIIRNGPSPHRGSQASQNSFIIRKIMEQKEFSVNSPDIHNL